MEENDAKALVLIGQLSDGTTDAAAVRALRSAGSHPLVQCFPLGAVFAFDRELRYLSSAQLGVAAVSLTRAEIDGRTLFEAFPPEVVQVLEPAYRKALAGVGSSIDVTLGDRAFRVRLVPVRDESGQIVAGMGLTEEVTEARRSERALRESEDLFRSTFEDAPIGKALITVDGRYTQVNHAMSLITGYSKEELLELSIADITDPEDFAADLDGMRRLLAGEAETYRTEKRYLTSDGNVVWAAKTASLIRDDDGAPLHFIAQVQDVTESRRLRQSLDDERRRLRNAEAVAQVGSWEWEAETGAMTWSGTLFRLYGITRRMLADDPDVAVHSISPEDRNALEVAFKGCLHNGLPIHLRYRATRPDDGEQRWFDVRGEAFHEDGKLIRIGGAVADVTDQVVGEAETRAAAHAFQNAVIKASPDLTFVYDVAARYTVWANRSVAELLDFGPEDVAAMDGRDVNEYLLVDEDRATFEGALEAESDGIDGEVRQVNYRLRGADGVARWFSRRTTPLNRDEQGRVAQVVGVLRDITDAMITDARLQRAALHDDLTALPNRRLVSDRLHQALNRSEREGQVVVLFCDLDGFKRINDAYGHHTGDAVLTQTASRLTAATRGGDTVGRMGGDEFVVICAVAHGHDAEDVGNAVAGRIARAMLEPFHVGGAEHRVTISIGICIGRQGEDADSVLRNADVAMYLAKSRGKDGYVLFETALHADRLDRVDTERRIRAALADETVQAFYQPIVDSGTGRIRGVEALLRVSDENGRLLNTGQVVTVAEQAGIISKLDDRVLRLACMQVAVWRKQPDHAALTVHINRSAADIARPGFHDRIMAALASTNVDPQALVLEITESVLLDAAPHAITDLRKLRAEGIGIAIDDFGTGYASLRYLATLPISCIKVDQSFTAGLPDDPTCATILRASVNLAADLDMDCVIEGVETAEQRDAVPAGQRVLSQGYFYARPQAGEAELPTYVTPSPPLDRPSQD